jgi:hypothetical protein
LFEDVQCTFLTWSLQATSSSASSLFWGRFRGEVLEPGPSLPRLVLSLMLLWRTGYASRRSTCVEGLGAFGARNELITRTSESGSIQIHVGMAAKRDISKTSLTTVICDSSNSNSASIKEGQQSRIGLFYQNPLLHGLSIVTCL